MGSLLHHGMSGCLLTLQFVVIANVCNVLRLVSLCLVFWTYVVVEMYIDVL